MFDDIYQFLLKLLMLLTFVVGVILLTIGLEGLGILPLCQYFDMCL